MYNLFMPVNVLPKYRYNAVVEAVVDGDTLDLLIDLGFKIHLRERVRLVGLDCPESAGKGKCNAGLVAKKFTEKFCPVGCRIEFESLKQEKYGRYLATVWKDGLMLNSALIAAGHAKEYFGGKR